MNRTTALQNVTKAGAVLRQRTDEVVSATWALADALFALRSTFSAGSDQAKAFRAAGSTAAGIGETMVTNLVRAVEVRDSLTTTQRSKVEGWSYDAVLSLASQPAPDGKGNVPMAAGKRNQLIGKVEKAGTQNVKVVRDLKRQVVGGTKRTRGNSADATTKLAKVIGERVQDLLNQHDVLALIAGAQIAQDNPGQDVAAAILLLNNQAAAAAKAAAKKAAA